MICNVARVRNNTKSTMFIKRVTEAVENKHVYKEDE